MLLVTREIAFYVYTTMSRLQGLNTTLDILSASSGAVVGWFLYRVVVTSCKRQWTRGSKTEEEHGSRRRRLLEERIQILEKENQTLYERTVALALENRLLYDRILQVAFVDEEEDVTHYTPRDEDEDWSWCWWQEEEEEEEEEDMKNVYKTPEKNVGMRQTDEVQTPTQDNDTCVHHG